MLKVLVCENDAGFAEELGHELTALGCVVRVVEEAASGLAAALEERPDLIIASVELPAMNGFLFCNRLKRDPGLKDVPLVLLSALETEETFERHRRLRGHADDYLRKPVPLGELVERLARLVPLELPSPESSAILLDEPDVAASVVMSAPLFVGPPSAPAPQPPRFDLELDDFLGGAFDNLLVGDPLGDSGSSEPPSAPASPRPPRPSTPTLRVDQGDQEDGFEVEGASDPPPHPFEEGGSLSVDEGARLQAELLSSRAEVATLREEVLRLRRLLRASELAARALSRARHDLERQASALAEAAESLEAELGRSKAAPDAAPPSR